MVTVSIVNVTSYTGLELVRILAQHPQFIITSVTGRSAAGERLDSIFPQVHATTLATGQTTPALDPSMLLIAEPAQSDLAFVCLPHAAAAEMAAHLLERGTKVVDLSADFRLHAVATYEQWYKHTHPVPALLETAVYGLCELHRERIRTTSLVANPGCHATTSILALAPALAAGIIDSNIIVDSKTGVSGAGRSLSLSTHYAEANEDTSAYSLSGHRHLPEITQELEEAAFAGGHPVAGGLRMTFLPHLLPMTRGILATCYTNLLPGQHLEQEDVQNIYKEYYAGEPFVHVVDAPPHTKWTYGSNHCFIHPFIDPRTQRLVVLSCLDNLVKGAAGQAVQNANLLYGFPETAGLSSIGVNP